MLDDDAQFCDRCGCKTVDRHCRNCGASMNPNSQFCSKCGLSAVKGENAVNDQFANNRHAGIYESYHEYTGAKTIGAYCAGVLGTVGAFFARKLSEVESSTLGDILDNRMYVGIESAAKPFFTIIPIMMAIIAYGLLFVDDETGPRNKIIAAIVATALIVLTLLIIWVDMPQAIY